MADYELEQKKLYMYIYIYSVWRFAILIFMSCWRSKNSYRKLGSVCSCFSLSNDRYVGLGYACSIYVFVVMDGADKRRAQLLTGVVSL